MKVLVWAQYFWPESFHINHVVEELQAQGVDVTVLTGKPNYPEGKIFPGYRAMGIHTEHHEGVEIIRLPLRARGKNSGKGMALNYLSFIVSGYLFALGCYAVESLMWFLSTPHRLCFRHFRLYTFHSSSVPR